jgi:hypothetical protein
MPSPGLGFGHPGVCRRDVPYGGDPGLFDDMNDVQDQRICRNAGHQLLWQRLSTVGEHTHGWRYDPLCRATSRPRPVIAATFPSSAARSAFQTSRGRAALTPLVTVAHLRRIGG